MRRYYLILLFIITCLPNIYANKQFTTEQLLAQLDSAISNRDRYLEVKLAHLSELNQYLANGVKDDRERFETLGRLYADYHSFNADSAYTMAQRQLSLARNLGDKNLIMNAMLNKANILCNVGMYHEALSLVDSIPVKELPDYLRAYYFHSKRTLYGNLANFSTFKPEKELYEKLTDNYRDSLLTVNDPHSVFYVLIKADQLNVHHKPQEAINLLESFIRDNDLSEHEMAICAYTLSESYSHINDIEMQKRMLLISAISDMKTAVREYVSLRQLALLLYQEGDLERAYNFLTIAVDDAAKSNSRQRIIELNDSYPMINRIYVETVHNQKKTLERTILIITILSVMLIVLLFYMRKQMLKIADGRRKVEEINNKLSDLNLQLSDSNSRLNEVNTRLKESNDKLNELNHQLVHSNNKLQEAYAAIADISELKEVYICQYMDQSLQHIEMLDNYRKVIGKLVNAGKTDDLKKLVKSDKIVEDELKSFYDQFDKTFLNLFPTFVEDFNSLLLPEEAIIPKRSGSLNTELRIFALIRLGITDSDKIAKFLRYSLTTIYNYRTKVRNKAKGDRNHLDGEVAKIGQHSSID
ncbi:DUF6377 domain-containing protein [uncultured Duncaniella sp.]|uniref:DUF6377 domain-containing protein n=1 Tax=uncultured Duncaniella sp. TaxID=2768039 RepID=UPI00263168EB|nr:DUF6377 domain-containing protein [uncultured Duncaniella sp.]